MKKLFTVSFAVLLTVTSLGFANNEGKFDVVDRIPDPWSKSSIELVDRIPDPWSMHSFDLVDRIPDPWSINSYELVDRIPDPWSKTYKA